MRDIYPGGVPSPVLNADGISSFRNGIAIGAANAGGTGRELFATDGTAGGTHLVRDIYRGTIGSGPTQLTRVGPLVYFSASTPDHGTELWVTDSTSRGTRRLTDLAPGPASSTPWGLTPLGSQLLFYAKSPQYGFELYRTDGTVAGTRLVRDIFPGPSWSASDTRLRITTRSGKAYFSATDSLGDELWVSDGTTAGTQRVADLAPGPASSMPRLLTRTSDNRLFFTASGKLWTTDGTAAGTQAGPSIAGIASIVSIGTRVAVAGAAGAFVSDGTVAGTRQVATFTPLFSMVELIAKGSSFWAFSRETGQWVAYASDGTVAGTRRIGILPASAQLYELRVADTATGVIAAAENTGLWSATATQLTKLDPDVVNLASAAILNGRAYYWKILGSRPGLWSTDGTPSGTRFIVQPQIAPFESDPRSMVDLDGWTLFTAVDSRGRELWRTDGTRAGTVFVRDIEPGSGSAFALTTELMRAGRNVFFYKATGSSSGLWRTDGTAAGTSLLVSNSNRVISLLTAVRDRLYFALYDRSTQRYEVWSSDGTAAGTGSLPLTVNGSVHALGGFAGDLYLLTGRINQQLQKFDGRNLVTLATVANQTWRTGNAIFSNRQRLFVTVGGFLGKQTLWSSDGTAANTVRISQMLTKGTRGLGVMPDYVVFPGNDTQPGSEVFATDGTVAGTVRIRAAANAQNMIRVGDRLLFEAFEGGTQQYSTDGTAAGTRPIRAGRSPHYAAAGSRHVFTGAPLAFGDGTTAGTKKLVSSDSLLDFSWGVVHSNGQALLDRSEVGVGRELFRVWPGANSQRLGYPCAGDQRWPELEASDPVMGQNMTVRAFGLTSGTVGFLVFLPPLTRPSPLVGTRCIAHGDWQRLAILSQFAVRRPEWTLAIPIPNLPAADRLQAVLRVLTAPTSGPLGGDLTNAVRLAFGD